MTPSPSSAPRWLALTLALALTWLGLAQAARGDRVSVSAVPQRDQVVAGDQFAVAVIIDMEEGWHIWPSKPVIPPELGDFVPEATLIHLSPEQTSGPKSPLLKRDFGGVEVRADWAQWPEPVGVETSAFGPEALSILSHKGRTIAFVPVVVKPDAAPGERTLSLAVYFQSCDDRQCDRPTTKIVDVKVTVAAPGTPVPPAPPERTADFATFDPAVFAKILAGQTPAKVRIESTASFDFIGYRFSVGEAAYAAIFLIAFGAGVLMNFTPCVLPVIPIKIMSLQHQAKNPRKLVMFGSIYCAGIVALFVLIGVLAFAIGLNFGEWFSYWWFAVPLGAFILFMGVGMVGVFSLRLPGWIYSIEAGHDTAFGNFKMGVLTGVLSTPCTGPMFGAAFAWATKQPPMVGLLAITTMGFGMAAPYLLLVLFPSLIKRLPRGGAGGELLKQVLGLFMVAVGIYIGVSSFGERSLFWAVGAVAAVAGVWWVIGSFKYLRSPRTRTLSVVCALLSLVATFFITRVLTAPGWDKLKVQTDEAIRAEIASVLASGRPIVIDFTANWCINCIAIENQVLTIPESKALYELHNARLLKVDFSNSEAGGWGVAREILGGAGSIPLIAVYGPATGPQKPVFFASFFKVSDLEAALKTVTGK